MRVSRSQSWDGALCPRSGIHRRGSFHRSTKPGAQADSGKELVWRDMVVCHFERELIADERVVTDLAERLLLARKG